MKVIQGGFGTASSGPDDGVVGLLRAVLERAERGEIRAVFVVGLTNDESVASGWHVAKGAGVFTMLGGIENTKLDFAAAEIEARS